MEKVVQVKIKTVYGVDHVYPANDTGKLLAQLAGTKTLTSEAIALIKKLGYKIEQVHDAKAF